MQLTAEQVIDWISDINDETIDDVLQALQNRHDALHEARAAKVKKGMRVTIWDVQPECLNGLEGVVQEVDDAEVEVEVRLSPMSTGRLRFTRGADYRPGDQREYILRGIPASCCYTEQESSQRTA